MQFLILGGTQLTGPHIARELIEQGHQVAVFHRGKTHADLPSKEPDREDERRLDGEAEADRIAMAGSAPPAGRERWT